MQRKYSYFNFLILLRVYSEKWTQKGYYIRSRKYLFKEGEVIFKEGDEGGKEIFFIDSGRVKIVKNVGDTRKPHWRYLILMISLER